jgi:hypothetical protein
VAAPDPDLTSYCHSPPLIRTRPLQVCPEARQQQQQQQRLRTRACRQGGWRQLQQRSRRRSARQEVGCQLQPCRLPRSRAATGPHWAAHKQHFAAAARVSVPAIRVRVTFSLPVAAMRRIKGCVCYILINSATRLGERATDPAGLKPRGVKSKVKSCAEKDRFALGFAKRKQPRSLKTFRRGEPATSLVKKVFGGFQLPLPAPVAGHSSTDARNAPRRNGC